MRRFANLKSYLIFSFAAAIFTGVIVAFGTRKLEHAIIGGLVAFIASIVFVATLDLSFKPDEQDPNKPRLR
ncbi:MAG: hypothetical protein RL537_48 [Actinomycetota bacterium]|jgi:predicted PurR-regulated permease PerM